MKLWGDFRNYFYRRRLAKTLNGLKTQRVLTNLNDALSISIIFDSSKPGNDSIITKFSDELKQQGKTVDVLGFLNDTKTEQKAGLTIFNKKNLSWALVPDDEKVEKFTAKNVDLLLACFTEEILPLEYITAVSKAKWKVGVYAAGKTDYYDLMIKMDGRNDLAYFLEQATIFLNKIQYDSK